MSGKLLFWPEMPRYSKLWAVGLGLISALGFQPIGAWPLAMLAMGGFALLLARSATLGQAALLGWLFGLGHFTLGNIWIASAFTFQAQMPAFLGFVAVPLVAAYLGIFPSLAAAASWRLVRKPPGQLAEKSAGKLGGKLGAWALVLAFAGCWILAEYLRATLFTGYAWNPFGVIFLGGYDRPGLAVLAPFMGSYALSGLAVGLSAGLLLLIQRRQFAGFGLGVVALIAGMVWPAGEAREGSLSVTIAQPDIRQEFLHDRSSYASHHQRLTQLSGPLNGDNLAQENGAGDEARLVLWPESGMVEYLREGYPQAYYDSGTALGSPVLARQRLGRAIGEGSLLLTGGIDLEIEQGAAVGAYNSVTALTAEGDIAGSYSKSHLVPFGEYLPFRSLLEPTGLSRFAAGGIDFLSGAKPRTMDLGVYGKAGIQICYEIIFSGSVTQDGARPDYIFNPSNDGWFGYFGPPQHLAQARLRAVEEGLPVVRATTIGISAIIDARGVVRDSLPWKEMGRIDGKIPPAYAPTLFAALGNYLALIWALLLLSGVFIATVRSRR